MISNIEISMIQVSRFASVLESRGVVKGDRVLIYMPMIPEAIVTMLACARIGAIHSLVFGGFASRELANRINHAEVPTRVFWAYRIKYLASHDTPTAPSYALILTKIQEQEIYLGQIFRGNIRDVSRKIRTYVYFAIFAFYWRPTWVRVRSCELELL